jgi:tetratricopeptide (TPR) repeat protein
VQHWRNSITLWEHALAVTRGSYRAHANLGATLFDQRRFRDAVPQLRAAVALDARDPELHLLLGQSLLVQNQLDEAVDVLEQSVRLAPDFVPAHFKLAQALHLLGRLDEARQHYALAARLQPTHSEAQLNLGRIDLDRGEFDSARAHFQLALRFNRSDPRAHAGLGQSYLHGAQGRWKEALVHLEDAVKLKPDALEHRRDLAFALYQLGRTGDAEAEYAETLRREPDWPHQAGAVAWEQATHPEARRRSGWEAWRRAQQACQAVGFRDPGRGRPLRRGRADRPARPGAGSRRWPG